MQDHAERVSSGVVCATRRRFRRAGRPARFVAVLLACFTGFAWLASAAAGQFGILTTPRDEIQPAANESDLLWSQKQRRSPTPVL